jgi:hypothetical protein
VVQGDGVRELSQQSAFSRLGGRLAEPNAAVEQMWAELGGNAMLMNFDPTKDGILYILKGTNNRGDLDFDCKLPSEQTQKSRSKIKRSATTSPQNRKQEQRGNSRPGRKRKSFHVCGIGAEPDGTGSGFAWFCVETRESHVKWSDGLTKEQSESRAIIAALRIAGIAAIAQQRFHHNPCVCRTTSDLRAPRQGNVAVEQTGCCGRPKHWGLSKADTPRRRCRDRK